ncbi:uncharacterized protein LOC117111377 [Anneissia japonica]|uniref:uncharacterized protein LOC117111377 n=1 Tax=Anneissia japonica TaxID=1529436 RepID=UPI0014254BA4|nr:uncharacterized protein LOC117111377 [Anneissia japonica]
MAARLVTGTSRFDHISPTLRQLHWLPVKKRIVFKLMLITYKSLNNQSPAYIREMIVTRSTTCTRSLRSTTDKSVLFVPQSRLRTYGDRAFAVAGPKLWNSLPDYVRQAPSTGIFKSRLKTHLYNSL